MRFLRGELCKKEQKKHRKNVVFLYFARVSWYNIGMKQQATTVPELLAANEVLQTENEQLRQQVQWLTAQMRLGMHKRFGASSEQSEGQMSLFNEAEQTANPKAPEPKITEVKAHYRKKTRLTTDKLPEDLPVEIIEHELPEDERTCPACGGDMHKMGEDCREELKIIPAKAVLVRHVRHSYSCRHCEKTSDRVPILKAKTPNPVIKGGFASPESVAHVAVQKFVMGSPLYRQEQEWAQKGILLSRQTMSGWLIKACEDWLAPVYNEMKRQLLARQVLHADETTLQVLHEDGKPAQSKSYMWHYRTSGEAGHQIVLYEYQSSRKAAHPEAFLKAFTGFLHVDGYDGYHKLPEQITIVGCWAHLRRKFDEALKSLAKEEQTSSQASEGLAWCNQLFHLEKQFALLTPEERFQERDRLSRPVMDAFFAWADGLNALPKMPLGKAVHYAKSQRKYLKAYLLDGRLEISNNRAENSIRPFVMGRKNWLFANTPRGATASAVYYSLIVSAKENGLVPFDYLSKVFALAPNGASPSDLLPWTM